MKLYLKIPRLFSRQFKYDLYNVDIENRTKGKKEKVMNTVTLNLDMKMLVKNEMVAVGYRKYDEVKMVYGKVESFTPAKIGHDARLTLHVGTDSNGKKSYRSFLESRMEYLNYCLTNLDGTMAFMLSAD